MSKKTSQYSTADMLDHNKASNHSQVDSSTNLVAECRNKANSTQQNGGMSSSPESVSLNGDKKQSGKRHCGKRCTSKPESHPTVKVNAKNATQPPDPQAGLIALQSECANVWFQRSIYEQAESLYQCWLANSPKVPAKLNGSAPTPKNNTSSTKAPKKNCFRHADHQVEESMQLAVPNSLSQSFIKPTTPDEGYQSQAPTPVIPSPQQKAVTLTSRETVNGLSPILAELFRDIWLEKPLYDRAEATYYQTVCGNNSSKQSSYTLRSGELPQSFVEVEEEVVLEKKQGVLQGIVEVFHALHPIQEEEEPAEIPAKQERHDLGVCYFLHPDSERVWLDKWSNMSSVTFLTKEKIWFDKSRYDEAERRFFERVISSSQTTRAVCDAGANAILQDIARARENIQKSLAGSTCSSSTADQELISRIKSLELENKSLNKVVEDLRASLSKLEFRVTVLEKSPAVVAPAPTPSVPYTNGTTIQQSGSPNAKEEVDDDDVDLFGSDDDEEAEKLKEQRLKEYAERKAKKPTVIAKSSILLDVKPWDDETDMAKLEVCVRSVQADGLLWGMSKLIPVGYGIKKLQISCVVEDDKVGTDMLEEEITKFEDYVQSVDVAAFNKI
ncbi:eukaryotic translation elongation factor 1 delta b (guanine nucleotide exchange protein) isoform X2 [Phyllopteryx taeniolatus]|uniref:eukaryotic translation elongation factor 1 delta b (guanine nucleotide exchange protein) isoform X2 n=1 Tax=Phyllopteryx taeniolatus TaxID=161469 RepID=UPI002AD530EC|nr:eukaryotic translation elongation factor 1 delta b (guanine nucleotide exchange protein) isoform X2 [Phyllopteryx taeniolatus]